MTTLVRLNETKHPDVRARSSFDSLIGIEEQKCDLLDHLALLLAPERLDAWAKQHHPRGLPLIERLKDRPRLAVLAGDVGCGKTALATSVGTPLADRLDAHVFALETPSDIRGYGLVGDLSARVTSAFDQARAAVTDRKRGLLIIDEGDDLGASRAQIQAHHEDRAGLNVLVRQIDRLAQDRAPLAVLLVTNRLNALDPALVRRAHVVRFARPDAPARRAVFAKILEGVTARDGDLDRLLEATERQVPFSYSDLFHRIAEPALRLAFREDVVFSAAHLLRVAERAEPTPLFSDQGI